MLKVQVFDPPMCCSTGICGPSVDPKLVRFAADLDWLKTQGLAVERFNLSQEPAAFAGDAAVKGALKSKGEAGLPLVKVNGKVKSSGVYPSREELAAWAGVAAPAPSLFTEAVEELVGIAAAVASSCEPCFKLHYDRARKLGVSREDMLRAVTTAERIRETPAKAVVEVADRYLRREGAGARSSKLEVLADDEAGACCPPSGKGKASSKKNKKSGCC
ncbi:MAG: arsenite efflux transporter metallochaperone ArsD [Deltaproteobacteria bacterium]|nr:arsenite efflux transporter metallochaperone ArsD [Deltaproteobacteria bacterium]